MVTLRSIIGIFVSIGLLIALALSPAFAQPAFVPPGLDRAIEAQERHTDDLLGIQGVVGTAVGLGADGGAVVKIYTERSGVAGLPRSLDGVPVVVQVTGKILAFTHKGTPHGGGGGPLNRRPRVSITSPADGDTFETETSISFEGTATDAEDGDLTGSLVWDSSINGSIEIGASFQNNALSDGIHTITASVTDSGGASGSDQITITVGNVVDPKARFERPVPIGVSSGTERLIIFRRRLFCTVGTLGARVKGVSGNRYALSNAHVYALEGSDPDGDVQVRDVQAEVDGDRILQPGRVDIIDQACGSQEEINAAVIGNLSAFVQIELSRRANNTVDAAIALSSTSDIGNSTPTGDTPSSTIFPCNQTCSNLLNEPVQKYGRTTSLTTGTVDSVNATIIVKYDSGRARFVGQVAVIGDSGPFSQPGDSGSLIVTQSGNNPVALLFAGGDTLTFGNPISDVLSELGTELGATLTIDGAP